jgi:hypothetical protein
VAELFSSGRAADLILAVLLIEGVIFVWRGKPVIEAVAILSSAVFIVLGLRGALVGADWPWIAAPLSLAFPAHLWDLSRRRDVR